MSNLRTKGKSTIVWLLMAMLLLGLGGFGVTSFSGNAGRMASVGDTVIEAQDYARALQNQMQNFTQQTGQAMNIATARSLGITRMVQAQLITSAALEEQARDYGVSVGDQRVASEIAALDAFRGLDGQFDSATYNAILQRQGMRPAQFEEQMRKDEAKLILQDSVMAGAEPPRRLAEQMTDWMLEQRDIRYTELTEASLPAPIAAPAEDTLRAWHTANADRFTAPEKRQITYIWLTPDMLQDKVDMDEAALRAAYDQRIAEFVQPERRMIARLVYESEAAAQDAKARYDAGQASFDDLAAERGLSVDDAYLGEMAQDELGAAGEPLFALDQPGVVGPVMTDLGPALYAMNAILDPVNVTFEQALPDLRAEAALDRARRQITEESTAISDLLAGGATLEDVARDTSMELGEIEWSAEATPEQLSIATYPAFREHALSVTESDFPELFDLNDGGVFALRLDGIIPPALPPFEQMRDQVEADWHKAELHRQLLAFGDRMTLVANADEADGQDVAPPPPEAWTPVTGLYRDGFIEGAPQALVTRSFDLDPGETNVVDADGRVLLVTLDRLTAADLTSDLGQGMLRSTQDQLRESLRNDVFDYFTRAIQAANRVQINQTVVTATESRFP